MTDFDRYIIQGEPGRKEKAELWQTARHHIEGDISIDNVKDLIDNYYKSKSSRHEAESEGTEEADKVSARITEILSEQSFSFTPDYLLRIHKRLFGRFIRLGKAIPERLPYSR